LFGTVNSGIRERNKQQVGLGQPVAHCHGKARGVGRPEEHGTWTVGKSGHGLAQRDEEKDWSSAQVTVALRPGIGSMSAMDAIANAMKTGTPKELVHIDPTDLHELLATKPERLLGRIIELNQRKRYHNSLDAIGLLQRLLEWKNLLHPTASGKS